MFDCYSQHAIFRHPKASVLMLQLTVDHLTILPRQRQYDNQDANSNLMSQKRGTPPHLYSHGIRHCMTSNVTKLLYWVLFTNCKNYSLNTFTVWSLSPLSLWCNNNNYQNKEVDLHFWKSIVKYWFAYSVLSVQEHLWVPWRSEQHCQVSYIGWDTQRTLPDPL